MKHRIIYAGLHIENLLILYKQKSLEVSAVAFTKELLHEKTFNPINNIFKLLYLLRYKEKYRLLEIIFLKIWSKIKIFSYPTYFRYAEYLSELSKNKTKILDLENEKITLDFIKKKNVDLLVVNTCGMLSKNLISAPRLGTVNVHPSKLPKYRGALPTLWALKNHDRKSAVTYMLLDKGMDTGKIIKQHTFNIAEKENSISLELKINEIIKKTFLSDINKFIKGELVPYKQASTPGDSKTGKYYDYMIIDWQKERGEDIFNKINLYPFVEPFLYCYSVSNNKKIFFKKADFKKNTCLFKCARPGEFMVKGFRLCIQTNGGVLITNLFSGLSFKDTLLLFFKRKDKIHL